MSYIIVTVTLENLQGEEDDYEVGADVEVAYDNRGGADFACGYEVSEPDVSAPVCALDDSRCYPDPQGGLVFAAGWSDKVEEALTDAYIAQSERDEPEDDYYEDDCEADDYINHMYEGD